MQEHVSAFTPFVGWLRGTPDFEVIYLGEGHMKESVVEDKVAM